ncbi:hypothetical protein CLPU_17c00690 [Gottschalkia purinilytica]|uniref:Uncharacterized protein n=1 Tax=Gottschalkia purinilytica TaxID=1503 RepID=A0A0L0W7E7_GOTPU|nr:hypothetical protein [Gottschalkia purinilytica]KNF07444.1 hypothetical protein CLPU_17c00690 [Gottschalkia purinilytica]
MRKKKSIFEKIEKSILRFCIVSIILLGSIHIYKQSTGTEVFFNEELDKIFEQNSNKDNAYVVLKKTKKGFQNIEILVNGDKKHKFENNLELVLSVKDNDLIEVDGSMYDESIKIEVVGVTENIAQPKLNTVVETNKSMEMLGKVELNNLE